MFHTCSSPPTHELVISWMRIKIFLAALPLTNHAGAVAWASTWQRDWDKDEEPPEPPASQRAGCELARRNLSQTNQNNFEKDRINICDSVEFLEKSRKACATKQKCITNLKEETNWWQWSKTYSTKLFYWHFGPKKPGSQSCAVAKSEQFWRATGQSKLPKFGFRIHRTALWAMSFIMSAKFDCPGFFNFTCCAWLWPPA